MSGPRIHPVDDETLAMIAELKAAHPIESCDLFATTTGRCTCEVKPEATS